MNLILFVAKIFLCSGILFTYYWFFLRNKRFHHYNRFYLLAIVILSLVFPFLDISISENSQTVYPGMRQAIDFISVNNWEAGWNEESNAIDNTKPILTGKNIALVAYASGLAFLFFLLVKSLVYIIRIRRRYDSESIGDLRLYDTTEPGTPFSFFKSIFWNHQISFNSKEGQQIFRHELFHVRQYHSSDSLFMELVCIICWFNPFFHLIRKELKAIHEFLADQYAISDNDRYAYAELLVLESIRQKKVGFVHPFFQNNIKRRIAMITKFQKTRYGYWSRVMALPILILLFCVITLKAQQKASIQPAPDEFEKAIQSITVLVDAGHGGKDPGAYSPDQKYVEKNLALAIAKKIRDKAPAYNINVILTREDDNAPELKDRTELASRMNADLLVSIHVGSEPPTVVKGTTPEKAFGYGIAIYNPKAGSPNEKQSKLLSSSLLHSFVSVYNAYSVSNHKNSVWVIDKAPCAAVLLECGNIAHKPDLEFILKASNQEKIAEAILKGIVAYKSTNDGKQVFNESSEEINVAKTDISAESNEPSTTAEEVNAEFTGTIIETAELENSNLSEEEFLDIQDDIRKYLTQHFLKNIRYPAAARQNNEVTSINFSVELDANGKIWSIDIYKGGAPKGAVVQDLVIVGVAGNKSEPIKEVKSVAHDIWEQELDRSIKSFEPPANVEKIKPEKYYFRAIFQLSNENQLTNVSLEPVRIVGTQVIAPVNVNNKVNVQTKQSDPVVAVGHPITSVKSTAKVNLTNVETVPVVQVNAESSVKNSVNQAVVVEVQKIVPPRNEPLPIDMIRKFKVGETTLDVVKQQLGQPSNQFMDGDVELLSYYGNNERLMMTFSREDGRLVNYSYFLDRRTKSTFSYDDVKDINKGSTPFKDILKRFGKPSEIRIDSYTESWVYVSDNGRLTIFTNDKENPIVNQMSFDSK